MSTALIGLSVGQGLAFITTLLIFAYRAGRLLERVESHEQRLDQLEDWRDRAHCLTNPKEA